MANSISSGISNYYGFAANPVLNGGIVPNTSLDSYSANFSNDWTMLFGKKLTPSNIAPIIKNIPWVSGTVYNYYDSSQDMSNSNFYVIPSPTNLGGSGYGGIFYVYMCIDNANGAPSTSNPSAVSNPTQASTFQTADGYKWRYIYQFSSSANDSFSTTNYIPVLPDTTIQASAANTSGIDKIVIANSGSGYNAYYPYGNNTVGVIQSVNNNIIQIDSTASPFSYFYNNSAIYINTGTATTSQLLIVNNYISNSSGNWVYTNATPNTSLIQAGVTNYSISPQIYIQSDAVNKPLAYCTINSSTNSIANVVIINSGFNVSWADISVISNPAYGTGANLYAIAPPPGGYGANPSQQLFAVGASIYFKFANSEANTIPTNITYNKIGLMKNPYAANAYNGAKTTTSYNSNTFNQLLQGNTTSQFNVGETVTGQNSGAQGIVAFSNSTTLYLTGDQYFINNEYIISSNGSNSSRLVINNRGNIYTKDEQPLYIQNLSDVVRSNIASEAFKLIIQFN